MLIFVLLCIMFPSSFVIILTRKRVLVALLLLSFECHVAVNVMWLFLTVPWVGLQFCDCGISSSYSLFEIKSTCKWVLSQKCLLLLHINDKGAGRTALTHSLFNAFIFCFQENIITKLATCKISIF